MHFKIVAAVAAAASALALASAAEAGPKNNQANQIRWDERQQMWVQPNWTPPGLAKKPGGMPPGQYKKTYEYAVGAHLPRTYYSSRSYYVTDYNRYRLRTPPSGYQWVRVDNDVYLAQTRTGLIAEVIADLLR